MNFVILSERDYLDTSGPLHMVVFREVDPQYYGNKKGLIGCLVMNPKSKKDQDRYKRWTSRMYLLGVSFVATTSVLNEKEYRKQGNERKFKTALAKAKSKYLAIRERVIKENPLFNDLELKKIELDWVEAQKVLRSRYEIGE